MRRTGLIGRASRYKLFLLFFLESASIKGEIAMTFTNLQIIDPILKALSSEGYLEPTPIQEQAIPILLKGKDLLASAQTGTGKTAAFAIPILQKLTQSTYDTRRKRLIKALVLTPTRELAGQIMDSFRNYGKNLGLKSVVIYGGVKQKPQTDALQAGLDILVATPGRLLDLIGQGFVDLDHLEYFVLDEADRMLDMGFINDVKKVIKLLPHKRQTMLFSATMPKDIVELAKTILRDPERVMVTPVETTIEAIGQKVYFVAKRNKTRLLMDILNDKSVISALVFSRTKHGANKIVKELILNRYQAEAIHGNKSQPARQNALNKFKNKQLRVLVATDIAARGLDIDQLSHVINFDLPEVPETYIHRIGRTGRAGLTGESLSFCDDDEVKLLEAIEKHIKIKIPVAKNHIHQENYRNGQAKKPIPFQPKSFHATAKRRQH